MNIDLEKMEGRFKIEIFNPDGSLHSKTDWIKNIMTNAGKAQIALLAGDATATPFTYLAVGTSSTAVAAADTALNAEITDSGLARAAATVTRVTTTVTNDTLNLNYEWTVSATKTVEEVGIFNASSGGTLLCHGLTTSQALTSGLKFNMTYQVKFA